MSKAPAEELRDQIVQKAFERGLLLLGCGKSTIRISPPLMVTSNQVDKALMIMEEAIAISEMELEYVVA